MDNSTDFKIDYLDTLSSDNFIEKTEAAYHLNKRNLTYEEIISILKLKDDNYKYYALINIEKIKSHQDAELIINCLNSNDSRVRESASEVIKSHLADPEYRHLFDNEYFLSVLTESVKDKNPKVCRNISRSLVYLSDKLTVLKKLVQVFEEKDDNNIKDIYNVYWCLFALENIINSDDLDRIIRDILNVIVITSESKEYHIRERSAYIVRALNQLMDQDSEILSKLTVQLSNDENFYVRNAILPLNQ